MRVARQTIFTYEATIGNCSPKRPAGEGAIAVELPPRLIDARARPVYAS